MRSSIEPPPPSSLRPLTGSGSEQKTHAGTSGNLREGQSRALGRLFPLKLGQGREDRQGEASGGRRCGANESSVIRGDAAATSTAVE